MDSSQEAANRAQIKSYRLTAWLVVIGIATLAVCAIATVFAAWPVLYPSDVLHPTSTQGGAIMVTGWIPVILLLCGSTVLAIALLVVAFRQLKRKQLAQRIIKLDADLKTANAAFADMEGRVEKLSRAANNAVKTANYETNQRKEFNRLYDGARLELANLAWVRKIIEDQAKDISEHVKATLATYPQSGELQLVGDQLCVIVGLAIKNESVFDITISPKTVKGTFSLNRVAMKEPVGLLIDDFRQPIENLKPKQTGWLVLEQPLREFEAERIRRSLGDDDAKFWIGGLNIPISVDNPYNNDTLKVVSKSLRIPPESEYVPVKNLKSNTEKA